MKVFWILFYKKERALLFGKRSKYFRLLIAYGPGASL
jgi:hypothetical protein